MLRVYVYFLVSHRGNNGSGRLERKSFYQGGGRRSKIRRGLGVTATP